MNAFWPVTFEPEFPLIFNFYRTLQHRIYFYCTQNFSRIWCCNSIKSSQTPCLSHFWQYLVIFCPKGILPQKSGSLTHNPTWVPNISFKKIPGQMDKRPDRSKYIRPFQPRLGIQGFISEVRGIRAAFSLS